MLVEMTLSMILRVINDTQGSSVISDGTINQVSYVVSRLISFVTVNPLDLGLDMWRNCLVLNWL